MEPINELSIFIQLQNIICYSAWPRWRFSAKSHLYRQSINGSSRISYATVHGPDGGSQRKATYTDNQLTAAPEYHMLQSMAQMEVLSEKPPIPTIN
ncbi:hypothetical protein J6590_028951 [Homalodisca vitripennis]|nr:hypothetical protein J6590_028951 [Homalodisca vitripennis]